MPRIKTSILIIESDPPTLELYRRELSRDFVVYACLEEAEALQLAQSANLSAVVLEPAISNGKGWCLLPELLKEIGSRKVPIILCSTQDERKRGLENGAAAFLLKPVLPVDLRETIRKIVK